MRAVPNFALRAAKHVQRRMIAAALSRLERLGAAESISDYMYVGLGSRAFGDFRLFHRQFAIHRMVSIEADSVEYERAKFNLPYACIDLRNAYTTEVLSEIDWPRPAIVWLDMCNHLDSATLDDVRIAATNMPSGSSLLVTVKVGADAAADPDGTDRIKKLEKRIGEVPPEYDKNSKLGTNQLARLTWNLITETIRDVVAARGDVEYHQIFHFRYRDSTEMLTVGGILSDREAFDRGQFLKDFPFCRSGNKPFVVEVPELTVKEMRKLDQDLPCDPAGLVGTEPVPLRQARKYAEAYRYFPNYVDAEIV